MEIKIKEKLERVLGLCYEISTTTKVNMFFSYAPHVNTCDVYYLEKERSGEEELIYIVSHLKIEEENLQCAIYKLEKFKEEVSANGTNRK